MQLRGLTFNLFALATLASAMPSGGTTAASALDSCIEHARTIPNPTAARGYESGCHIEHGNKTMEQLDALYNTTNTSLDKRQCSTSTDYCCCMDFCSYDPTCGACYSGCASSCQASYPNGCIFAGCEDNCP